MLVDATDPAPTATLLSPVAEEPPPIAVLLLPDALEPAPAAVALLPVADAEDVLSVLDAAAAG